MTDPVLRFREPLPAPPVFSECLWYISFAQPKCGADAPHEIEVKGAAGITKIHLCDTHKAVYDRIRVARARHNDSAAQMRLSAKLSRIQRQLNASLGRESTANEIAEAASQPVGMVCELLNIPSITTVD